MNLVRPCEHCPFRTDIRPYLRASRVWEIEESLDQGHFPCHETLNYDDLEDGEEPDTIKMLTDKSAHCAGAMILLEKLELRSNLMRVYERMGWYDPKKLDMKAPIFDSFDAMANAQED